MNRYLKTMNIHIPEVKLYSKNNNIYIQDKTYEEVREILAKFAVPAPLGLQQTKYMMQTYSNKEIYQIDDRYYLLKKNRNSGNPYLYEL